MQLTKKNEAKTVDENYHTSFSTTVFASFFRFCCTYRLLFGLKLILRSRAFFRGATCLGWTSGKGLKTILNHFQITDKLLKSKLNMYLKMIQNRFYSLSSAPTKACRTSKESSWPKDQFETKEMPLGAAVFKKTKQKPSSKIIAHHFRRRFLLRFSVSAAPRGIS